MTGVDTIYSAYLEWNYGISDSSILFDNTKSYNYNKGEINTNNIVCRSSVYIHYFNDSSKIYLI